MLNGNIQILHDLGFCSHDLDEFIIDLIRIDIVYPNPMKSIDLAQLTQQFRQQTLMSGKIRTIAAGILGYNDQLFHTASCQESCLIEHIIHLTAAELTPQCGNNAVGAAIVTALRNFDKRIVFRSGEHTAGFLLRCINGTEVHHLLIFQQGLNGRNNFCIAAGTQNAVYLRQFLQDILLISLGQASGNQDLAHQTLCLQRSRLQNILYGLTLRGINKTTGVDHHNIAANNIRLDSVAGFLHAVHHPLAIYLIFCTAKRNKSNVCHFSPPGNHLFPQKSIEDPLGSDRSYALFSAGHLRPFLPADHPVLHPKTFAEISKYTPFDRDILPRLPPNIPWEFAFQKVLAWLLPSHSPY